MEDQNPPEDFEQDETENTPQQQEQKSHQNKIQDVGDRRYTGVGTLIITKMNNKPYLLLGRESFKSIKHRGSYMVSIFEEFGGGIQRRKATLEDNACYELREETSNLLDFTQTPQILKTHGTYYDLPFREDRIYRLYMLNIPDIQNIIPYLNLNRQVISRSLNNPAKGAKSKIKTYLEMDTIKLVSLDAIRFAMEDINNYVCFKAEDTIWNLNAKQHPYRGILKVDSDTFINERLIQFLGGYFRNRRMLIPEDTEDTKYTIQDKKMGIDICYENIKNENNKLEITKPTKITDTYYKFLVGTFSFLPVL